MSASDNLSQQQFFHVSPQRFEEGTVLSPGAERDQAHFRAASNRQVYMTGHQEDAEGWASHIGLTHGYEQMHVHQVEPDGAVEGGHGDIGQEYTTPRARVVKHLFSLHQEDYE
jgi:hypothetical protein